MGDDAHKLFCVDLLYPKSTQPLNDLSSGNEILAQNMAHASHVNMSVCSLYTGVLREVFHIQPAFALGYSLGEGSMMTALRRARV